MNKLFLILIIIIIIITLIVINIPKSTEKNKITDINIYIKEYKDRYKKYKENNPNLNDLDIVTRVNLNLDKPFYSNIKEAKDLNKEYILVNKYNYLNNDYKPDNLVKLEKCSLKDKLIQKIAIDDFYNMCDEIKKNNLNIRVVSSYRSFEYQKTLYENYVLKDGQELADTYSARAGFSEHQTGLAIDIDNGKKDYNNFDETEEFKWMIDNSYKYGFILRYPYGKENITGYSYESWHFRYVGKEHAKYIYHNDLTLDEYYIRFLNKD